jgi:transcriptional regulator GlxA family with amidase domain
MAGGNPFKTRNVGIFVFDDVEVLDFAGPFEVFNVSNELPEAEGRLLFNVFTIGEGFAPISARGGLQVTPAYALHTHPPLDILIVPGGDGRRTQMHNPPVLSWLQREHPKLQRLCSVCTGAFILANAGLLKGCQAVTYHSRYDEWRITFPQIPLRTDVRFVDNSLNNDGRGSKVVTSAGISAGIDMSLHVLRQTLDGAIADADLKTALLMEYDYKRS